MKYRLLFTGFLLFVSMFSFPCGEGHKVLDLKVFKITIPKDWIYKKQKGMDSFVGKISTKRSSLSFDYSTMGYASFGPQSEEEYLKTENWLHTCPFCKPGVTYTNGNVNAVRKDIMEKEGIVDPSLVKVEPYITCEKKIYKPSSQQKRKFPKADCLVDFSYKGQAITEPIMIPDDINHIIFKLIRLKNSLGKLSGQRMLGEEQLEFL